MKNQPQWEEVARRGRNHAVLSIDMIAETFNRRGVSRVMEMDFDFTGFRQFDGARWFLKKDYDTFIQLLKEYEAREPGYLLKKAQEYQRIITDWRAYGDAQHQKSWETFNTQQLLEAFNGFVEKVEATFGMVYN